MARLDALPSIDVIRGYKGVLDFYLWRGLPCVRAWPAYHHSHASQASKASAMLFGQIIKGFNLTGEIALGAFQEAAVGNPRTARDIYVSGVLGHLHQRTEPVTPDMHFDWWMPDAPPETPSLLDDEFDDAAFDAVLWTEFDPGALLAVSENETGLILDEATQAGDDLCGIYQPIPAVDFTITVKLALIALAANFGIAGLILWDDATNPAAGLYIWDFGFSAGAQAIELTRFTNFTTWHSHIYQESDDIIGTHIYLRIRRLGANYAFDWSSNGLGWRQCWKGPLAFAPDHFGIGLNNVNSGITIRGIATFFRYTPFGTFNRILQGDRVREQRGH